MTKSSGETRDASGGAGGQRTVDPGDSPPSDVTMTLWTRAPICGSPTTVIDRLGRLRATGAIADFEVRTWPDEVVLSEATADDPAVRTFERFESWADERSLSVRPAFDVRTRSSLVGRARTILTLPMMCLAVTAGPESASEPGAGGGDDLVGVFPCRDGGRTWTIDDYLTAFEASPVDGRA